MIINVGPAERPAYIVADKVVEVQALGERYFDRPLGSYIQQLRRSGHIIDCTGKPGRKNGKQRNLPKSVIALKGDWLVLSPVPAEQIRREVF